MLSPPSGVRAASNRTLLYVAEPGIRNYTSYGGVGVLVYDATDNYRFIKRIPTWDVPQGQVPDNVKGIAASARTGYLYVTNIRRLCCIDLGTDKIVWDKAPDGGCDRLAISPDGTTLYVPSFEGPHWNVLNAGTGNPIAKIIDELGRPQHHLFAEGTRRVSRGAQVATCSLSRIHGPITWSGMWAPSPMSSGRSPSTRMKRCAT